MIMSPNDDMKRFILWGICGLILLSQVGWSKGIQGQVAPEWGVDQWVSLPSGVKAPMVSDYKGKVVYVYGFQSWCPGCHRHGFPTLTTLIDHYQADPSVVFIAIQTTFEGFSSNGPKQASDTAKRYDLKIPVGQSGLLDSPSKFMKRYHSGGTPWTVIIGKDGKVKYNDFHITPQAAMELIDELRQ